MNSTFAAEPREFGNYTDRAGAELLKSRIEAYWRERGYEIQVSLAPAAFSPALRAARYDIRSELVNGWPRALRGTTSVNVSLD